MACFTEAGCLGLLRHQYLNKPVHGQLPLLFLSECDPVDRLLPYKWLYACDQSDVYAAGSCVRVNAGGIGLLEVSA